MKKTFLVFILHSLFSMCVQAQLVENKDTLYLNYFIAAGEFGGHDEGVIIYVKDNELNAMSVRYNNSSTSFILKVLVDFYEKNDNTSASLFDSEWTLYIRQRDSLFRTALVEFYKKNMNSYTVLKPEWALSKEQHEYIVRILDDIKTRPIDENVFSNASEHYVILAKKENYVFIDRVGHWKKHLELKRILDIEQQPKKLKKKKQ